MSDFTLTPHEIDTIKQIFEEMYDIGLDNVSANIATAESLEGFDMLQELQENLDKDLDKWRPGLPGMLMMAIGLFLERVNYEINDHEADAITTIMGRISLLSINQNQSN